MNYTREHILRLLQEYSDLDMQHREWTENLTKTYVTPMEFFAEWLDDIFPQNPGEIVSQGGITQEEWNIIQPFDVLFREFAKQYEIHMSSIPADMTSYEPWRDIAKKSGELKESLQALGWKSGV